MGEELMAIEVHFEKRINNSTVIREADTRHRREYLLMTMFAGLFLVGLLFYGWQHYQWIQHGYRIEEALKRQQELEQVRGQLRLERSSLRDLQVIDAYARGRLGMVVAGPGQIVILSAEAPLTIPSAPPAEEAQTELAAKQ
jgi:hypothetical protein